MPTLGTSSSGTTAQIRYPGRLMTLNRFSGISGGGTLTTLGADLVRGAATDVGCVMSLWYGSSTAVTNLIGQTSSFTVGSTRQVWSQSASGTIPDVGTAAYLWLCLAISEPIGNDHILWYTDETGGTYTGLEGQQTTGTYPTMPSTWTNNDTFAGIYPGAAFAIYTTSGGSNSNLFGGKFAGKLGGKL